MQLPGKKLIPKWLRVLLIVVLVAGAVIGCTVWYKLFRTVPQHFASQEEEFKYGSIGVEAAEGIPYWIWLVLPRVFPEYLPGSGGYASLGIVWEEGHETPVGFSKMTIGFPRIGINCAICHSGSYRTSPMRGSQDCAGSCPPLRIDVLGYQRLPVRLCRRRSFHRGHAAGSHRLRLQAVLSGQEAVPAHPHSGDKKENPGKKGRLFLDQHQARLGTWTHRSVQSRQVQSKAIEHGPVERHLHRQFRHGSDLEHGKTGQFALALGRPEHFVEGSGIDRSHRRRRHAEDASRRTAGQTGRVAQEAAASRLSVRGQLGPRHDERQTALSKALRRMPWAGRCPVRNVDSDR